MATHKLHDYKKNDAMVYFILASVSFFLLLDFKSKFTGNLEFYNFLNPVFTTSTHCFLCFNDLLTLKNCRRRHHKKISVKWERFEILIDLLYCFFFWKGEKNIGVFTVFLSSDDPRYWLGHVFCLTFSH